MVDNLNLAHLEHEFHLYNSDNYDFTGIHSNMSIQPGWDMSSTESVLSHRVIKNIEDRYGFHMKCIKFVKFQEFEELLKDVNYHVMSVVDPFYIEASPYYKKDHAFSVCIVNGKDTNNNTYSFIERKHQQSHISIKDFRKSFDYFNNNFHGLDVYIIHKEKTDLNINNIDLRIDLSRILANLKSPSNNLGLNAIKHFSFQYENLLKRGLPFLVPWTERCFGERHANGLFFRSLIKEGHSIATYFIEDVEVIIGLYEELADLWRSFEMFHMFAVSKDSPQILHRNIPILCDICTKESLLTHQLNKFYQQIENYQSDK